MRFLVDHNHNFYVNQSFGKMAIDATIVTVTLDSYQGANCGSYSPLGYWAYPKDEDALDMLLNTEVQEVHGFDPMVDFDFQVYTLPYCSSLSWAGIAWVGVPGAFLSITGYVPRRRNKRLAIRPSGYFTCSQLTSSHRPSLVSRELSTCFQ